MPKNLWSKMNQDGYMTVTNKGMSWKILKAYQRRSKEKENPYARWLCIYRDFFNPNGEIEDVYIKDVLLTEKSYFVLDAREIAEEHNWLEFPL